MFESLTSKAITASIGFNDGANNGFWRIQPRDDEGQWIEMGADVLFRFLTGDGSLVVATSKGIYVGPSGRPGFARVLVKEGDESGLTPGVYEIESRNLQQFKAIIPNVDSGSGEGSSRKDKFGRPVQTLEDAKLPTLKGLLEGATPATPEDERLARGELSPEETAAEADGRAKSPIADLPAGFEAENPEETKKLLRESGIEPDDFDSSAKKSAAPAQRGERPIAYGFRNMAEFRALPDGAILDEYERAQYYPNPDGYDGPFGPVLRQIIKQDGRWFRVGKNGKAIGKPFTREQVTASLRGGNLTDPGAASKLDENGNQVAVWADEVESSAPTAESPAKIKASKAEAPKRDVDGMSTKELVAELEKIDSYDPAETDRYLEVAEKLFGKSGDGEPEEPSRFDGMSEEEKDKELAELLAIFQPSVVRNSANEAYLDAFEEGAPAPDLDELIQAQVQYSRIILAKGSALNKGDVITDGKGNDYLIENLRIDLSQGGQSWIEIRDAKGARTRVPLVPSRDYSVVDGSELTPAKPAKPVKPAKPTAKPEAPAAPSTPEPPKAAAPKKVVPKKAPKSEEVNKTDRADDGGPIAPSEKTDEELRNKKIRNLVDQNGKLIMVENDKGNPRQVEDPNAIIDALLEENPNAKIKEDGTIVVERGSFTDTDGKTYNYEVGVQRTIGNQFMERYTVTDPETGEVVYDFYNSDYKDSFAGLYGKTSGLTKTRDLLLGKTTPGLKGVDAQGVPVEKELRSYFGPDKNMAQRLKYLRKTKDMNNWRLLTADETIAKFLTGRARKLNKSDTGDKKNYRNQFGNVSRSFVASFYEAVDSKDFALVKERLVQLLGRLPNSPESIDKLVSTLRAELGSRYKGTALEKVVQTLPMNLKRFLQSESFDLRNKDQVPFVSEDGVTIVAPGDQVRFVNNEGDLVIGTVVRLNAVSGKNGGYKDTAAVRFGDGQVIDNLQTRNMLHTDDAPTPYEKWVKLDEKLRRRADELGIDFEEYAKNRDQDSDFNPEEPDFAGGDANAPYLGEDGESADDLSAPSGATKLAEEMQSGDPLYDSDGGYIGTVQQVKEVPATDGGEPGIAIQYLDVDGDLQTEILDKGEGRGPK